MADRLLKKNQSFASFVDGMCGSQLPTCPTSSKSITIDIFATVSPAERSTGEASIEAFDPVLRRGNNIYTVSGRFQRAPVWFLPRMSFDRCDLRNAENPFQSELQRNSANENGFTRLLFANRNAS